MAAGAVVALSREMHSERAAGRLGNRRRDLDQLLLTLWNALSSDWAFLVTRGQSVD